MKFIDLTGETIGNFRIVKRGPDSESGHVRWICVCICGREITVHGSRAHFNKKGSCGCIKNIVHGCHRKDYTAPEYSSWRAMRNRCLNKKDKHYKNYGGRGITICERWNSFSYFLEDMGRRPDGMSLDRIDHNGNYEPSNCRWADSSTQAKNRRSRKSVENFSTEIIVKEYNRRFPEAEYGLSFC